MSLSLPARKTAEDSSFPSDKARPFCGVFTHSMQRNGANIFAYDLVLTQKAAQHFVIFSPEDGPMRSDFEALGMDVHVVDTKSSNWISEFESQLVSLKVGFLVANTIMRCDIVALAHKMDLPYTWVIHETWPQDQFEYYLQEVFLKKDVTADMIRETFALATSVVFPSIYQKDCYKGLYRPSAAHTVYCGIPLDKFDRYNATADRDEVRAALGYSPDDFVILHIGTICARKGQIDTAKACARLMQDGHLKNGKVLMVGARYIRDHEIAYIDAIKEVITSNGQTWSRYEDSDTHGEAAFTFMDIQSDVLPFYVAADVVLVPSLNEVVPYVIKEGMAFKKPVICSDIDAIPEGVSDGVDGFLIPAEDPTALAAAVKDLYEDPAKRQRFGEAGRKRVENQFSLTVMGEKYRSIMDKAHLEFEAQNQVRFAGLLGVLFLFSLINSIPKDESRGSLRRLATSCPADPSVHCASKQCCPGGDGYGTYPCPSSPDFEGCSQMDIV